MIHEEEAAAGKRDDHDPDATDAPCAGEGEEEDAVTLPPTSDRQINNKILVITLAWHLEHDRCWLEPGAAAAVDAPDEEDATIVFSFPPVDRYCSFK